MRNCSKWIFDLDGTLTKDQHDFNLIRTKLGVPTGHLILEYTESLPDHESKNLLNKLADLEKEIIKDTRIADGARELLEVLKSRSHCMGVLTRNTKENALATLKNVGLKDFFPDNLIVGREEEKPKPDPNGIFYLLKKWKTNRNDCAIVGDYSLDLEAGRRAGIVTILVDPSDQTRWADLTDFRVTSLIEIRNFLENP